MAINLESKTDEQLEQLRLDGEQWRPAVGFEETHLVSSLGRVVGKRRKLLSQHLNAGYPQVTLRAGERLESRFVHILVAEAFIGPRPDGMEVCHGDGNRQNPSLTNLRYGTRQDNANDRVRHGRAPRGSGHKQSKMTEPMVREARALHRAGLTVTELAHRYGMSRPGMSHIINRRHWRWLEEKDAA